MGADGALKVAARHTPYAMRGKSSKGSNAQLNVTLSRAGAYLYGVRSISQVETYYQCLLMGKRFGPTFSRSRRSRTAFKILYLPETKDDVFFTVALVSQQRCRLHLNRFKKHGKHSGLQ